MINVDVTRISSKGQVVIPQDMRREFSVGDRFVIIKSDSQFILKPVRELGGNFVEDLLFAKRTMDSLERFEKGKFKSLNGKAFLAELERW